MRVSTEYNQFLVKKDILNSAFLVIFHQFHGKNVHFGYPRFWASVSVISRFYKSGGFGSITVSVPKYRPKTVGSPVSVRTDPALLSIVSTLLLYLYWQKKWQVISIVSTLLLYVYWWKKWQVLSTVTLNDCFTSLLVILLTNL